MRASRLRAVCALQEKCGCPLAAGNSGTVHIERPAGFLGRRNAGMHAEHGRRIGHGGHETALGATRGQRVSRLHAGDDGGIRQAEFDEASGCAERIQGRRAGRRDRQAGPVQVMPHGDLRRPHVGQRLHHGFAGKGCRTARVDVVLRAHERLRAAQARAHHNRGTQGVEFRAGLDDRLLRRDHRPLGEDIGAVSHPLAHPVRQPHVADHRAPGAGAGIEAGQRKLFDDRPGRHQALVERCRAHAVGRYGTGAGYGDCWLADVVLHRAGSPEPRRFKCMMTMEEM